MDRTFWTAYVTLATRSWIDCDVHIYVFLIFSGFSITSSSQKWRAEMWACIIDWTASRSSIHITFSLFLVRNGRIALLLSSDFLQKKKRTWEDRHQAIIQKFSAVIAFLHIILVDHCFFCLSCLAGIKENEIALRIKPSKRPRRNRRAG